MEQHTLEDFDGATYDRQKDQERLSSLLSLVHGVLADGRWHTLEDISGRVGAGEASVSARVRDLRKFRFGSHVIESRRARAGLWVYRLVRPAL